MRSKILVTGGSGLLGYALKARLPDAVYVGSRDGDLTDLKTTQQLFKKHRPKRVIHLAAKVGGVKENAANNANLFAVNTQINTNVLSVAQQSGVQRLISVLSSCCYQFYDDRSSSEDDLHAGLPFGGNLGYGYAKRTIDIQSRLLFEQFGCQFSTITPVTMYGANDNWDLEAGHVVASLIRKCLAAKRNHRPLEVWGSGKAIRQFVYAADVARILLSELDHFKDPGTLIIAADNGITIRQLAMQIACACDFKGEIVFDRTKPEGARERVLASKRFTAAYPRFQFTALSDGLRSTVEWFAKNKREKK